MLPKRAIIFLGVGIVSSLVYLATMSAAVELFGLSVPVAALLAFLTGTAVSYAGNTWLTFQAKSDAGTLTRFLIVVGIGMGLNQIIAYGLDRLGAHYLAIWLTVFIVIPAINFVGHSLFTYRERPVGDG